MKKRLGSTLIVTGLLSLVPSMHAQAVVAGTKNSGIQVGAGVTYLNPDYGPKADYGVSGWVDANLNSFLGLEAEGHYGTVVSPSDYGEDTYLVGPRLGLKFGKALLYGKAMVGIGDFVHDLPKDSSSKMYNIYAFGGGIDYRVSRSVKFRLVDAEFQNWGTFKPNGLTPYVVSTGIMYVIH